MVAGARLLFEIELLVDDEGNCFGVSEGAAGCGDGVVVASRRGAA